MIQVSHLLFILTGIRLLFIIWLGNLEFLTQHWYIPTFLSVRFFTSSVFDIVWSITILSFLLPIRSLPSFCHDTVGSGTLLGVIHCKWIVEPYFPE